jgi:GTPase SAR1 family protein
LQTEKILIIGLPGAGKTTLARHLVDYLVYKNKTVDWFDARAIREKFNDWDSSYIGMLRQSHSLCEYVAQSKSDFVICNCVLSSPEIAQQFTASSSWIVWLDTITKTSTLPETKHAFVEPLVYDFRISEKNADVHAKQIIDRILSV